VTDVLSYGWSFDPAAWAPTAALAEHVRAFSRHARLLTPPAAAAAEIVDEALRSARATTVVDLCTGASGPVVPLSRELQRRRGEAVQFVLTDLFPNLPALERVCRGRASLTYRATPVNALACTEPGFRTLFGSFHHFRPKEARALLADAVRGGHGIAVVEMTSRTLGQMLFITAATVVFALLAALFLRPFSLRRFVCTWVVPIVPLVLCLDGLVSCLRTYSTDECRALIASVPDAARFEWTVGTRALGLPWVHMAYLVGVPRSK
jgi:hypothetical protein